MTGGARRQEATIGNRRRRPGDGKQRQVGDMTTGAGTKRLATVARHKAGGDVRQGETRTLMIGNDRGGS